MGALLYESDNFTVVASVSNGERKCHRGIFLPMQELRTHEFQQGEVAEYLGVSRALLSKWIRTGLLKPTGTPSGKQRAYTVDDVTRAVIVRTKISVSASRWCRPSLSCSVTTATSCVGRTSSPRGHGRG